MFDFSFFIKLFPGMVQYIGVTLLLTVVSFVFAFILGVALALLLHRKIPFLSKFIVVWISFFRGTPLIAQLFFLYFGLVQLIPALKVISPFWAAAIALGLHFSAYMAITIKSAIETVDKGQMEACLSTGLTVFQSYRQVILPQAARIALPSLSNNVMDILKSTSLAFTLGLVEMMAQAQIEATAYYRYLEAYTAVIVLYWIMNALLTLGQKKLEQRMSLAY